GHFYHKFGHGRDGRVALRHHRDDAALAGFHFLNIAHHLLIRAVAGGNDYHRHILVDEGDGAVLHLGSGVALGVDIADFFELER
nr:hypothetical protein [Tanacetum cinerariifolium]